MEYKNDHIKIETTKPTFNFDLDKLNEAEKAAVNKRKKTLILATTLTCAAAVASKALKLYKKYNNKKKQ